MTAQSRTAAHERRIGRALLRVWWSNLAVWVVLLLLLFSSLGIAYVPLGAWNTPMGIAIAAVKAALVGYFFMTLRRAPALILLCVAAGALFVTAMFSLTFNDLLTRF